MNSEEKSEVSAKYDKDKNLLYFADKQELENFINSYETNKNDIYSFYDDGFIPFEPIEGIDEQQFKNLVAYKNDILNKSQYLSLTLKPSSPKGEETDEEDNELIKNDKFSSLLNAKGEIQIKDSIYRYTPDGIYIVNVNKQRELDIYLETDGVASSKKLASSKTSKVNVENLGMININEDIKLYVPERQNFKFEPIYVPTPRIPEIDGSKLNIPPYRLNGEFPTNTSNYNVCVNQKAGLIDNIFGRTYVCEYRFSKRRKLRTIFAVEDYYIYSDVFAQAKFKKRDDLGLWYSVRDAEKVYLKINEADLSFKDRKLKLKISVPLSDVKKFYAEAGNVIDKSYHKVALFVSNIFTKDDKGNTVLTDYNPSLEEIAASAQAFQPVIPKESKAKYNISFDFTGFFGSDVKEVVVITAMGKDFGVKNNEIIKMAFNFYKDLVGPYTKKPAGLVVLQNDIDKNQVSVSSYKITNEIEEVKKLAIARKSFKIPQNVRLNELTLGFGYGSGSTKIGLGLEVFWRKVDKVSLDIEAGALYDGKWGGSKFIVKE